MWHKRLLLILVALLTTSPLAVGEGQPGQPGQPAAAPIVIVTAQIQTNVVTNADLRLTAQLVQTTANTAPYQGVALPLATFVLTPAQSSPSFSQNCILTNSNTMLECELTPSSGSAWSNGKPLVVRVRLTSSSGHTATTLATFAGGPAPFIQSQIQAGNPFPGPANSTPIWVVAHLVRNVTNLTPSIQSSPLTLSSFSLTSATSTRAFITNSATCGLTSGNTMFECQLTPSPVGSNWTSPGGPLVIRLEVTATDGGKATTLLSFRPSP